MVTMFPQVKHTQMNHYGCVCFHLIFTVQEHILFAALHAAITSARHEIHVEIQYYGVS